VYVTIEVAADSAEHALSMNRTVLPTTDARMK